MFDAGVASDNIMPTPSFMKTNQHFQNLKQKDTKRQHGDPIHITLTKDSKLYKHLNTVEIYLHFIALF
jgi:hypothetical protein